MFLGTYRTKFSGKARVILPKKFREQLSGVEIYLTKGLDGGVWGFKKEDWLRETARQLEIPVTSQEGRDFRRVFFSGAGSAQLDRQGRFIVPNDLLISAQIKDEVVIVGAGDHFELWSPKDWQKVLV